MNKHPEKTAVILVNLGSPEALNTRALRRFYAKFLSDRHVVDLPRLVWWPILYGAILPFRPQKILPQYAKIWTENGSPLIHYTNSLAKRLAQTLKLPVHAAMSYSKPSLQTVLSSLEKDNIDKLIILPLYPQYSRTTTASVFNQVNKLLRRWRRPPELKFIEHYATHPAYIQALTKHIQAHWQKNPTPSTLILSFHGLPERNIQQGDPYLELCQKTTKALAENLNFPEENIRMVFQSRFGKAAWLKPFCNETLKILPTQGHTHIDLICPGFPVDCLETLYEINDENRQIFLDAGGEKFHYIPALNDSDLHLQALTKIIGAHHG